MLYGEFECGNVRAQGAEEGDLAPALSAMLGVYVGLKGEVVPENVKKWNLLKVGAPSCCRSMQLQARACVTSQPAHREHRKHAGSLQRLIQPGACLYPQ